MKVEVLITVQYYDNKAFYEGGERWAAKGIAHFKVTVDNFWLMYSENEDVRERFTELIANQNSSVSKYEYVKHEILWYGIEEIDGIIE